MTPTPLSAALPAPVPAPLPPGARVVVVETGPVAPTSLVPTSAASWPCPPSWPADPRWPVALLDAPARRLADGLAAGWLVVGNDSPLAAVAVSTEPDPDRLRRVRAAHPALPLLALVPADAPADLVVRLLEAGADGCLRGADSREVDAHLRVLRRPARTVPA